MDWFWRLYGRRIVNVNVNVVVAGTLALALTVGVMHVLDSWNTFERIEGRFKLPTKIGIGVTTFVVDLVADVLVYYGLHWLANHMPRRAAKIINPAYANLSFVKDATLVQFERAALSPILYVIALGLQTYLLHHGRGIGEATAIGFGVGICVTRVLHTAWMLYQEQRAKLRLRLGIGDPQPSAGRTSNPGAHAGPSQNGAKGTAHTTSHAPAQERSGAA